MQLRMKNLNIIGVHWKIRLLGGEGWAHKNQYRGGYYQKGEIKKEIWQFTNLRGGGAWQERG